MVTTEEELKQKDLEAQLERATEEAIAEAAEAGDRAPEEFAGEALDDDATRQQEIRILLTVGTTVTAAAMMVGGIFIGVAPRIVATIAGALGILVASRASRTKNPWAVYGWFLGGVLFAGLLATATSGFGALPELAKNLREASTQGDLLRPPVVFVPGWRAMLGWSMGCVGFMGAWIALELKRPALGLLIPVPVVAFGAISVPKGQQLATGLVCLVLLAIGLGMLSSLHERGAEDEAPGLGYEFRRAMRAVPIVAGVTIALFVLSKSNLLFPPPLYDPTQQARLPRRIPLSEVQDRVLFEVSAKFSGPWKVGSLDVYDGKDWRLPPYNDNALAEVDETGVVDETLELKVSANFTIRGLTGAILPGLSNTVGVVSDVPNDMKLSYDERVGAIRVTQGQFRPGFEYTIVSSGVPRLEEVRSSPREAPREVGQFQKMPPAPAAVQALLQRAPDTNLWDRLDYLRKYLLDNVTASGQGVPISITPNRVAEMITTNKEGTPYEIVAAQAMLARWAGIPSRIGYGFDGGDEIAQKSPEPAASPGAGSEQAQTKTYQIRPKHGTVYLEVYFNGHGWLPIIGDPLQAKINLTDAPQQFDPNLATGDNISVNLFIPTLEAPKGELFRSVRAVLGSVAPAAAGVLLVYILWPVPYKALRRARRRTWAIRHGPAARISLAYAEWRDLVTDFGYTYSSDPPLMFLSRFAPDDEHSELAWLVTRVLWGDLRDAATLDDAVAAEELSTALRQRLGRGHPWTLRAVAALSRLSIRNPHAAHLGVVASGASRAEVVHAA